MNLRSPWLAFWAGCCLLAHGVWAWAEPLPKGQRLLGIDLSNSANATYDHALLLAKEAGMEFTTLSLAWDAVESANTVHPGGNTPGAYSSADWGFANDYYPAYQVQLAVNFNPLDTNQNRVPDDLKTLAFNDPNVISRYQQAAEFVLGQLSHVTLVSFTVGNEIDIALATGAEWSQYTQFVQAVSTSLQSRHPGLPVGVKATFYGHTQTHTAQLQSINQFTDLVMVTYYPMNPDFTVRDPQAVANDFSSLVALYPAKPIYVMEAGYQSATTCASSEALQAAFVSCLFAAWDQHADRIPAVNYLWLHDRPETQIEEFSGYYGSWDPRFREYLRTLGMRRHDGTDKPAFAQFKNQAASRGWHTDYTPTATPTLPTTATITPSATPRISGTSSPNRVSAYPNPGRSQITFASPHDQGEAWEISLYNTAGECVARLRRPADAPGPLVWSCAQAAPGIYLARVSRQGQPTEKFKLAVTR